MYISIYIVIKTFITQVNENAMLSPGHVTKIHGARKDRVRKRNKLKEATIAFKRKRLQRKVVV